MHAIAPSMAFPLRAIHVYSVAFIMGCGCMGFLAVASILSRQNSDSFFVVYALALAAVFVVLCAITFVYLMGFRKAGEVSPNQPPNIPMDDYASWDTGGSDKQACCICLCEIQPLQEYMKMHCCSGGMHDTCLEQYIKAQSSRGLEHVACPLCRTAVLA